MAKIDRKRWWALIVLCLGVLMTVLDTTIVNVALPSIKTGLDFSETSLVWVINAYMLTFGGFLLLGGRLGDLFGQRRVFLVGIAVFTLASLGCGLANSKWILIVARALQGIGGAIVSAVSLSLIMNLFTKPLERAEAMGVFGFVAAGGGSVGVLLGGFLTSVLDWHWIFLVNIPIGILVFILCLMLLPSGSSSLKFHLDIFGSITVTSSLILAVYSIVNGNNVGWMAFETLGLLGLSVILMIAFLIIESKVHSPLMPLNMFKLKNVAIANIVGILWAASMFAWFFLSALYLQLVLGYSPLKVGLAFLPANLIMAIFSLGISAKIVMRFGTKVPLTLGMFLVALGLALFARAPMDGTFVLDVLPGMILLGVGAGMALNPLLLTAMSDVPQNESGLASGLVNTAFMMGGALGLAVLASIAQTHTKNSSLDSLSALNSGYHLAFIVGAFFALIASITCLVYLKSMKQKHNVVH